MTINGVKYLLAEVKQQVTEIVRGSTKSDEELEDMIVSILDGLVSVAFVIRPVARVLTAAARDSWSVDYVIVENSFNIVLTIEGKFETRDTEPKGPRDFLRAWSVDSEFEASKKRVKLGIALISGICHEYARALEEWEKHVSEASELRQELGEAVKYLPLAGINELLWGIED